MLFGKIRPSGAKLQAAKYGPLKNCSGCFLMTSQAGGCGHKNNNGLRLIKQSPNKKHVGVLQLPRAFQPGKLINTSAV